MLASLNSREISEWRAYELTNGPVGAQYEQNALAEIHEMLQQLARILIAQHANDQDDIPSIQHFPRPNELSVMPE